MLNSGTPAEVKAYFESLDKAEIIAFDKTGDDLTAPEHVADFFVDRLMDGEKPFPVFSSEDLDVLVKLIASVVSESRKEN